MKPKTIWANLAVSDLQRTRKFYSALGFKSNDPHNSPELTSFFFGKDDFIIHFFLEEILKKNTRTDLADLTKGNEIIFSLSVESKEEVERCAEEVKKAGGTVCYEPEQFDKGYTFVFADPDGHKFNVLYWPGLFG